MCIVTISSTCVPSSTIFLWCFNVCLPCLLLTIHSFAPSEVVWNILQKKKKTEEETYQMEYWTAIFDYLVVRHTSELNSFHYWDVLAVDCFWLCCVQNCDPVFHLWWSDLKGTECVIQPDVALCGLQDVKIQSLSNCWKCSIVILMCAYVLLCRILKGMELICLLNYYSTVHTHLFMQCLHNILMCVVVLDWTPCDFCFDTFFFFLPGLKGGFDALSCAYSYWCWALSPHSEHHFPSPSSKLCQI